MISPALVMAAVNGARRMPSDHPALPITVPDIARCAASCFEAGADAVHVHVRDRDGAHVLDAGLYGELVAAARREAGPDLIVQITTETVGRFTPLDQRAVVEAVRPEAVSVALREMVPDGVGEAEAAAFYARCLADGIAVQHIVYSVDDYERLIDYTRRGIVPQANPSALFVLGRYAANQESELAELVPFLEARRRLGQEATPFMVCAFGRGERPCLGAALAFGGNARCGFENAIVGPDGNPLRDNAESVTEVRAIATALGRGRPDRDAALKMLGR